MTSGPVVEATTAVLVASYPAGARYGPRTLRDHEFVWILRGSARWRVGDPVRSEIDLRPGQLALAQPGTVDSYQWDLERETMHAYVHFTITDLGLLPPPPWPSTRSMSRLPALEGLCQHLLDLAGEAGESDGAAGDTRRRSDRFLGVLLDLFIAGPVARPAESLSSTVTAVLEVVRGRWRSDLTPVPVPVLAAGAGVSAGHLFRVFRTEYGCSPARALEAVRLARAAMLLQRSNASLTEIAHRCGFANAYHFSRRFAAGFGSPPGGYRASGDGRDPYEQVRATGLLPIAQALLETGVSAAQ